MERNRVLSSINKDSIAEVKSLLQLKQPSDVAEELFSPMPTKERMADYRQLPIQYATGLAAIAEQLQEKKEKKKPLQVTLWPGIQKKLAIFK